MNELIMSALPKTWIVDVDGTLVEHNGYLRGEDRLLPGVREFFDALPPGDMVILVTARAERERAALMAFLHSQRIAFSHLICGVPVGERILINDSKPSGLITAYAVATERDAPFSLRIIRDSGR